MDVLKRGLVVLCVLFTACDDDDGGRDGGLDGSSWDGSPDAGPLPPGATRFLVRIENVAGPAFPTTLGAGAWVAHAEADPLFTEGSVDRGQGLEALAEDGDPAALVGNLDPAWSGGFGPTAPGEVTEVVVTARPEAPRLSFASGFSLSNDVFVAPPGDGIALFDEAGEPLPMRDVTRELWLWNAGTEADQAPGLGPNQMAFQDAPGTGDGEIGPRLFTDSTRTLPLARDLIEVRVEEEGGEFTVEVENVGAPRRLLITTLSPIVWVVHGDEFELFETDAPAPDGLEAFAEDANPAGLVERARTAAGVSVADDSGARFGGSEVVRFTVRPDAAHPNLTVAVALLETNDAFVAMKGVRLLDESGAPRDPASLELAIRRALAVYDAGTEANEVPGAGWHQAQRQEQPGAGDPDPVARVRRYDDLTNDFAGVGGGGFGAVEIRNIGGLRYEVRLVNTSGASPNPGLISPSAWALHDGSLVLLTPGTRVSRGMEALAEDCLGATLADELRGTPGVREAAALYIPDGAEGPGPVADGESYSFEVEADATHRWIALATMPFPSNDVLLTVGVSGVAVLDESGRPRPEADIARDVDAVLLAWDGGTEANQSGAFGHDMSPWQEDLDVGADEGDGTVRREPDPVWSYPAPEELVRVTISPLP